MGISRNALLVIAVFLFLCACSCRNPEEGRGPDRPGRLKVVTSLFPLYDFARAIAGGHADVKLLLPPGVEPHSFEPKPADMATLADADIFIYTNPVMEPWAEHIVKALDGKRLLVVNAGTGVAFTQRGDQRGPDKDVVGHNHELPKWVDPHVWLDFGNARIMVDTIAAAFCEKDTVNRDVYRQNAEAYKNRLDALDRRYRETLSGCRTRLFVDGGHFTFGYLSDRYGLTYRAAYGISPDAEPTARTLVHLSALVKANNLRYIFCEELLAPRIAETIARETGASVLTLHGAHNISREEFAAGTTFVDLMNKNLELLAQGLDCR